MAKAKKAAKKKPGTSAATRRAGVKRRSGATGSAPKTTARRSKARKTTSRGRASADAKARAAGRMGGPSIPLRDLIRGGMPRSPKARGGVTAGAPTSGPLARRRMKTAHGMKAASGTTLMQYEPPPLEHVASQRAAMPKR